MVEVVLGCHGDDVSCDVAFQCIVSTDTIFFWPQQFDALFRSGAIESSFLSVRGCRHRGEDGRAAGRDSPSGRSTRVLAVCARVFVCDWEETAPHERAANT